MSYFFSETRKRRSTVALVAISASILAACSGPSALGPSLRDASRAHPLSQNYPYVFTTVDTTASTTNKVMGINQLGHIIGTYGSGTPNDPYGGFNGHAPYTQLKTFVYPNAKGTLGVGTTSDLSSVGAVIRPHSLQGTWGFLISDGIWTITKDRRDGIHGSAGVTEFTGVNNQNFVTGFYVDPNTGYNVPFEFDATSNHFVTMEPDPNAVSATANGINAKGDIVGFRNLQGRHYGRVALSQYQLLSNCGSRGKRDHRERRELSGPSGRFVRRQLGQHSRLPSLHAGKQPAVAVSSRRSLSRRNKRDYRTQQLQHGHRVVRRFGRSYARIRRDDHTLGSTRRMPRARRFVRAHGIA